MIVHSIIASSCKKLYLNTLTRAARSMTLIYVLKYTCFTEFDLKHIGMTHLKHSIARFINILSEMKKKRFLMSLLELLRDMLVSSSLFARLQTSLKDVSCLHTPIMEVYFGNICCIYYSNSLH